MAVKAQYNSGTGKAKYTAGTGKQQEVANSIPAVCWWACSGTMPSYIDATFDNNLLACSDSCILGLNGNYWTFTTPITPANWNGNTFRMAFGNSFPFGRCDYAYTSGAGSFGVAREYSDSGCTTLVSTHTWTRWVLFLQFIAATTYTLSGIMTIGGAWDMLFFLPSGGTIAVNDIKITARGFARTTQRT